MLIRHWCIGTGLVLAGVATATYGCSDDPEVVQASEFDGGGGQNGEEDGSGGNVLVGDGGAAGRLEDGGIPEYDGSGDEPCGAEVISATHTQVNVLLVIDKSGSMGERMDPDGPETDDNPVKWSSMDTALTESLTAVQEHLWLGLVLYPHPAETAATACEMATDDSAIRVEVAEGTTTVSDILAEVDTVTPSGGTPTAAALAGALEYFTNGAGSSLEGDKYVLLATDGGPNCNADLSCGPEACTRNLDGTCPEGAPNDNCCDESIAGAGAECLDAEGALEQVQALQDAGIGTFVVGIPGSDVDEYVAVLNDMAEVGGYENPSGATAYYAVSATGGTQGLTEVLIEITRELITSCELQLDSTPPDLDKINVELDGNIVPQEDENGWVLDTSTSPPTVRLVGSTCAHVEDVGVESVDLTFGCPTVLPE